MKLFRFRRGRGDAELLFQPPDFGFEFRHVLAPRDDAELQLRGFLLQLHQGVQHTAEWRVGKLCFPSHLCSAKLDSLAVRQMRQSRFRAPLKRNRRVASSFEYPFRLQKKPARLHSNDDEDQPKRSDRQEPQKQKEEHKVQAPKDQPR